MRTVENIRLGHGSHMSPDEGMCAMEAVAWLAGEPHSDKPACACPVIGSFVRSWNDALNDDDRNRLLPQLLPSLIGTKSTLAIESRRSWLAVDWMARTYAPAWLRLVPDLVRHAEELQSLPEVGAKTCADALSSSRAARAAARDAARAAAGAAAWAAARGAARAAAGAAARAAAGAAARGAARDAARAAAGAAARDALEPTVEFLQLSAVELVQRMIAIGGES